MKFCNSIAKFHLFDSKKKNDNASHSHVLSPEKSNEVIQKAIELRNKGEHLDAIKLLDLVSNTGCHDLSQVAKYELGVLYSQLGSHNEADKYLHDLGFKLKLSNSIWCPMNMNSIEKTCRVINPIKQCAPVVAFDDILPEALLESLLTAFSPSSPFWSEHNYPTEEFFSYNVKATDQHSLMNQLMDYLTPLINEHFPKTKNPSKSSSTEWWCHMRDETSGFAHQLHFDLDEEALSNKSSHLEDLHPLVSAVLYLSDQNVAGPTLVTNQTLDADSFATEAWLCHPSENKLLLFDGNLLHGVVPYLPSAAHIAIPEGGEIAKCNAKSGPRITLMMGWWDKSFTNDVNKSSTKNVEGNSNGTELSLGPNMPMPSNPNTDSKTIQKRNMKTNKIAASSVSNSNPKWLSLMSPIDFGSISCRDKIFSDHLKVRGTPSHHALVHIDGPIWVPICRNLHRRISKQKRKNDFIEANLISYKPASHSKRSREDIAVEVICKEKGDDNNDCGSDAVEFISIAELNKLRMESNVSEIKEKEVDNDAHNNIDTDECKTKQNDVFGNAVEFISIAELNRLRIESKNPGNIIGSGNKSNCYDKCDENRNAVEGRSLICKKRQKNERKDMVFVGKWFLKTNFEIRDEVLLGCKKT